MLLTDNILLGFPISSQFCLKTDVVSCILEPLKPFLGWFCFHVDLPRKEAAGYLSLKYQVTTSLVIKQSTLCSSNSNSPVWIILFKPVGELWSFLYIYISFKYFIYAPNLPATPKGLGFWKQKSQKIADFPIVVLCILLLGQHAQ